MRNFKIDNLRRVNLGLYISSVSISTEVKEMNSPCEV